MTVSDYKKEQNIPSLTNPFIWAELKDGRWDHTEYYGMSTPVSYFLIIIEKILLNVLFSSNMPRSMRLKIVKELYERSVKEINDQPDGIVPNEEKLI